MGLNGLDGKGPWAKRSELAPHLLYPGEGKVDDLAPFIRNPRSAEARALLPKRPPSPQEGDGR